MRGGGISRGAETFLAARDLLLAHRTDYAAAVREFRWPKVGAFNWAVDHFDRVARSRADAVALRVVDDKGRDERVSFAQMASRANRVANYLSDNGLKAGDRLLLALGNVTPLWEMMLACIKLGIPVVPATTLLRREEIAERIERANVKAIITESDLADRFEHCDASLRIVTGAPRPGWRSFGDTHSVSDAEVRAAATRGDDPLVLYFTSGTAAKPKLVEHTHASYPIGHLTTMFWLGLQPGDVHLNLSSPGWAKHAWSSLFAPWNAEATVLAYQYERFSARALLDQLVRCEVTTFCAPPTVWRMLVQEDLRQWPVTLRELLSAGEPLNAEIIDRVGEAWNATVRDGYGQTETTLQVGNCPGQPIKAGSMGRPMPGYVVDLRSADGATSNEGEICLDLAYRPVGLMQCYRDDPEKTAEVMREGYYHTGDIAVRDAEGYLTFVGRNDDVFKSSDYRISPFELESVLIEHPAVVEAAVVPSRDTLRLSVPKAYITLAAGFPPDAGTACEILRHVRDRVAGYKRVRRVEFGDLPKTISGKIRRVQLRQLEFQRTDDEVRRPNEFWEEDL